MSPNVPSGKPARESGQLPDEPGLTEVSGGLEHGTDGVHVPSCHATHVEDEPGQGQVLVSVLVVAALFQGAPFRMSVAMPLQMT